MEPDNPDNPYEPYLRELINLKPLPKAEQDELFRRVADGESAKKKLLEAHLGLVVKIADRYSSAGTLRLQLVERGNMGLLKAINRFSDKRVGDFTAYAESCIDAEIMSFLNGRDDAR